MSWWLVKQRKNVVTNTNRTSNTTTLLVSNPQQRLSRHRDFSQPYHHRYQRRCFFFVIIFLVVMVVFQWKSSSIDNSAYVFAVVDDEQRQKYQQQAVVTDATTATTTATTTQTQHVQVLSRNDTGQGKKLNGSSTPTSTTTFQRAIFLISMGKDASESGIVERCLVSIRRRGQWNGPVVLLTDAPSERYQWLTPLTDTNYNDYDVKENGHHYQPHHHQEKKKKSRPHDDDDDENDDPLTIVLHPKSEHYNWNTLKDDMPYKRFKTFVLDYIDLDRRLDAIELVYYLDVDIVIGAPLIHFFQDIETQYNIRRPLLLPQQQQEQQQVHRLYLYKGNYPLPVQSGQLIMERYGTRNCLERWRTWLDNDHNLILDQLALRNLLNETTMENNHNRNNNKNIKKPCQIILMDQEPHLHFPSKPTMVEMMSSRHGHHQKSLETTTKTTQSSSSLPTLIHIKNSKTAGQIQWSIQKQFFRHILQLSKIEETEGVRFVRGRGHGNNNHNNNSTATTTMADDDVNGGGVRRIKVARPMVFQPSKVWSQQQNDRPHIRHVS